MLHIHPALRAREQALQNAGLLLTLDSVGATVFNSQVSAGQRTKQNHNSVTFNFNGTVYKEP